ncbi:mitochondrial glycine transporter A isoform X2 [Hyalella azteca]|uniref:Mitochondrial glycine transporter n=1 Tax=Hyalella azteca TaxID=294128 RepID=A0A8B7P5L8_HYAAZ|nr:mitochondrial glycine transporter A isoform X2 [Hyalella azteca]
MHPATIQVENSFTAPAAAGHESKQQFSLHKMQFLDLALLSPVLKSFVAGSLSGTCSTILFQPLDLVKTRLQTRSLPVSGGGADGMLAIFEQVVRRDNIQGLWRGMAPSMYRCVPGVGLYFSSLHSLKTALCEEGRPLGAVQAVLLGVAARTISGVTMIPMTVVKTRYESDVYRYRGVVEAVRTIYSKEGARGLTCGLLPTLLRDAPFSGLYLMFYTQIKYKIPEDYREGPLSSACHFSCGVISGLLASAITQPFDVVKTKMQLYPDKFSSLLQVVIYVRKKYGYKGYFKGLVPRMLRRTLMAAMAWTVYENMMQTLKLK